MKKIVFFLFSVTCLSGCEVEVKTDVRDPENWSKRAIDIDHIDSLEYGKSYLSVYSQIYSFSQKQKYNLTELISMRNMSIEDTIYLLRADYYDTGGELIRTYFDKPVYLRPMETTEIAINPKDAEGGTGSNFIIEWKIPPSCPEPLIEGVMISMQGSQGLGFTTHAKKIE